jgi:uncharacterized protein YkwD
MTALVLVLCALFAQGSISSVSRETKFRLVNVINEDRSKEGLAPVKFSEELSRVADAHCREMLREGYTSHWDRAGWKPYLRYAATGLGAYTSENIGSLWETSFPSDAENVWGNLLYAHRSFMEEKFPNDGHRQSILDPKNMFVGIGVAYDGRGMRMIEVFGTRAAELDPLPLRAKLHDALQVRGRLLSEGLSLMSISVFYEPLPRPMTLGELRATSSYGLPEEEERERPKLSEREMYADRIKGTVEIDPRGVFRVPLTFWKRQPGVYTVAVWVRRGREKGFIGALVPILVEAR